MEFAKQLISYVVKLLARKISKNNNLTDKEKISLFKDVSGNKYDNIIFLHEHLNDLDDEIIDSTRLFLIAKQPVYDNDITCFNNYDNYDYKYQFTWNYALSFMVYYNILYNYNTPLQQETLDMYAKYDSILLRYNFFHNSVFANNIIRNFLKIICNDDLINDRYECIKNNKDDYEIIKKWENNYSIHVDSINHILRDVFRELYDHYTYTGVPKKDIPSYISAYFIDDFDPIKRLQKLGFDNDQIKDCKKIMLKLMLADLYEDSLNDDVDWIPQDEFYNIIKNIDAPLPTIKSKNNAKWYYKLVRNGKYYEVILSDILLRNILFYNYHDIIVNKERFTENRSKTILDNRVEELIKINPYYMLD